MDNMERTAAINIGGEEYTLVLTTRATKQIAGRYGVSTLSFLESVIIFLARKKRLQAFYFEVELDGCSKALLHIKNRNQYIFLGIHGRADSRKKM